MEGGWGKKGAGRGHIIHFSHPVGAIISALILHALTQERVNYWLPHVDDTPFISE